MLDKDCVKKSARNTNCAKKSARYTKRRYSVSPRKKKAKPKPVAKLDDIEKSITRKTVHNMNDAEHSSMVQNSSKIFTSENEFFWIKKSGL